MNETDLTRLRDMLDAVNKVLEFASGRSRSDVHQDDLLAFALVHAVQIIGEAARLVSESTQAQLADIPWAEIVGMRHKLVHDYFSIDRDIVWDVVEADLPPLKQQLEAILGD